jgi:hypothetical protein
MTTIIIISISVVILWQLFKKQKISSYNTNLNKVIQNGDKSGNTRQRYPNFVKAITDYFESGYELVIDDKTGMVYKLDQQLNGIKTGEWFFVLQLTANGHLVFIIYKKLNGLPKMSEKAYFGTEQKSASEYREIFVKKGLPLYGGLYNII